MMKEELRACFEREEDINSVSVNSYQYMIAALQETLRIWPAIPSSLPRTSDGCFINGKWVPKVGVHQ
jgi:cytochrome P450